MMAAQGLSRSIAVFVGTTHERKWMFSAERLMELRGEANRRAAQAVREASSAQGAAAIRQSPGKRAKMEGSGAGAGGGATGVDRVPECLSVSEERVLQDHFLGKLHHLSSNTLKLPLSVETCALAYFQRFYLRNSVMDYHPRDLMYTVLWVACKVEHYPARFLRPEKVRVGDSSKDFSFDAKAFAMLAATKDAPMATDDLIRLEQVLLQSLDYNFMVFHPYRALRGLVESWAAGAGQEVLSSDSLLTRGEAKLCEWLQTDLALMYHPAELALTAIKSSVKAIDKETALAKADATGKELKEALDSFLSTTFRTELEDLMRVAKVMKAIDSTVSSLSKQQLKGQELEAEVTRLLVKLGECSNPDTERSHPWHEQMQSAKRLERDLVKQEKIRKQADEQRQRQSELLGTKTEH